MTPRFLFHSNWIIKIYFYAYMNSWLLISCLYDFCPLEELVALLLSTVCMFLLWVLVGILFLIYSKLIRSLILAFQFVNVFGQFSCLLVLQIVAVFGLLLIVVLWVATILSSGLALKPMYDLVSLLVFIVAWHFLLYIFRLLKDIFLCLCNFMFRLHYSCCDFLWLSQC